MFVRLLERPTIALLPDAWRAQLSPFDESITVSVLARVSIALVLGAATHIVWDSFTHASPVVAAMPALRAVVLQINSSPVRVYDILQHLSTIVGFRGVGVLGILETQDAQASDVVGVSPGLRSVTTGDLQHCTRRRRQRSAPVVVDLGHRQLSALLELRT